MNIETKTDEAICGKEQLMAAVDALNVELRDGARIFDHGDYIARHIQSQNMPTEEASTGNDGR